MIFPYLTTAEAATKSGLTEDQLIRVGFTGRIIFAVLDHEPRNYEEVSEVTCNDGTSLRSSKSSETIELIKPIGSPLCMRYISPEDLINVIQNEAPGRKTLVRRFYDDRSLDPRKGLLKIGNAKRVSKSDLVIPIEEYERFEELEVPLVRKLLPLPMPERLTLYWLFKNLSVLQWSFAVCFIVSTFAAGVTVAQSDYFKPVRELFPIIFGGAGN